MLYRQQPSPWLYTIDIWPARNSRLVQRETNHYINRWASVLAWSYLAECWPTQLVVDLLAQHHRFVYVVHNGQKLLRVLCKQIRKPTYLYAHFLIHGSF